MGRMLRAELRKLRGSRLLIVAVAVPLVAVVTGGFNYRLNAGRGIEPGWDSLWSQVVVFYSLFFFSMGIAVLAAGVWRLEHAGSNWTALMTTTMPPARIIAAKAAVLGGLILVMQCVLVAGTWVAGRTMGGLGGGLPVFVFPVAALAVVAGIAVAAWQSLISMLVRSFALSLALGFAGTVLGVLIPMAGYTDLAYALPYSLVGRALATGSVAMSDAASLESPQVIAVVAASATLIAAGLMASTWFMRTRDARV